MKSLIRVISVLLITIQAFAQAPLVKMWDKRFGGTGTDEIYTFIQTTDGGYLLGGSSRSPASGDKSQPNWDTTNSYYDYWIVKIDSIGDKQWDKRYGGTLGETLASVQQTTDGGYILGGWSGSGISGDKTQPNWGSTYTSDYWIVKIDSIGNKEWDKRYGGTTSEALRCLQQTMDGGYILGGTSTSDSSGDKTQDVWRSSFGTMYEDYWIVKIDAQGNKEWDKRYGGNDIDYMSVLLQSRDGGYLLAGQSYTTNISGDKTCQNWGGIDMWVVKTDSLGNKLWDKCFGGFNNENLAAMQQTADGGFILAGSSPSGISGDVTQSSRGSDDMWIVKIDSLGNKQWDKRYGGTGGDGASSIAKTADGGFLIGGASYSPASGDKSEDNLGPVQAWVVKTDSSGNKLWDKTILSPLGEGYAWRRAIPTNDQGYAIANHHSGGIGGYKTEPSWGGFDYWIVKFRDSTLILPIINTINVIICTGESYFAGGSSQTSSGTYYDTLTAVNGSDSIIITNLSVLPHSFSIINLSICDGESYFAGGANQTTSGNYYDTITAANGCDSILTTNLLVRDTFVNYVSISILTGDSIFLGGSYQTVSGTYLDILNTANGCDSVIVSNLTVVPNPITIFITSTAVSCGGAADGSASIIVTGGVSPYRYQWSSGDTSATVSNLQSGSYTVTVIDASNQTIFDTVIITQPLDLIVTTNSVTAHVTCFGASDGAAKAVASGGTPPYSFLWSKGQTDNSPTDFPAGTHSVTVTDYNGCTATTSITIAEGELPCTGIQNNLLNNTSLYPNPTSGTITVKANIHEPATLILYDALGRQVWKHSPASAQLKQGLMIDLKDESEGIYFLNILTAGGSQVMKVVKY